MDVISEPRTQRTRGVSGVALCAPAYSTGTLRARPGADPSIDTRKGTRFLCDDWWGLSYDVWQFKDPPHGILRTHPQNPRFQAAHRTERSWVCKIIPATDLHQWSGRGSNPQPLECHSSALPIAPPPHGNEINILPSRASVNRDR